MLLMMPLHNVLDQTFSILRRWHGSEYMIVETCVLFAVLCCVLCTVCRWQWICERQNLYRLQWAYDSQTCVSGSGATDSLNPTFPPSEQLPEKRRYRKEENQETYWEKKQFVRKPVEEQNQNINEIVNTNRIVKHIFLLHLSRFVISLSAVRPESSLW